MHQILEKQAFGLRWKKLKKEESRAQTILDL